jgi:hypothetical protein
MKDVNKKRWRIILLLIGAAALFFVWAELAVRVLGTPFAGT